MPPQTQHMIGKDQHWQQQFLRAHQLLGSPAALAAELMGLDLRKKCSTETLRRDGGALAVKNAHRLRSVMPKSLM